MNNWKQKKDKTLLSCLAVYIGLLYLATGATCRFKGVSVWNRFPYPFGEFLRTRKFYLHIYYVPILFLSQLWIN